LPVDGPIVILLTIDSLRADVLDSKKHDNQLPTLAALRDSSLYFTEARAPGSQTVYTLSELFMGKYFSQQYWSRHPALPDLWPDDDDSVRFPQLLTDAGIPTVHYATTKWLVGEVGIVRGFAEEQFIEPAKTRYTLSSETFPLLIKRLEDHPGGPLFIYTHILDAHFTVSPIPGNGAKKKYLNNLEVVDGNIRWLLDTLDRLKLRDRTYLIISSDHGEAFGEHNTYNHRYTIYEELLRVPLLIAGPRIKARPIDTPVSVIDIGPTILDLFGQPVPGPYMGESLAGFVRGGSPKLTRPIAAETRLKRGLIFPDGFKAILDDRHGTAEVYNLKADPGELINLLDADDPRAAARVNTTRKFFDTHMIQRKGYKIPFRP
ncbi:MAG TPA: sulfatase-like hydrolase/transferase, partial [Nannocystis sp.]